MECDSDGLEKRCTNQCFDRRCINEVTNVDENKFREFCTFIGGQNQRITSSECVVSHCYFRRMKNAREYRWGSRAVVRFRCLASLWKLRRRISWKVNISHLYLVLPSSIHFFRTIHPSGSPLMAMILTCGRVVTVKLVLSKTMPASSKGNASGAGYLAHRFEMPSEVRASKEDLFKAPDFSTFRKLAADPK